MKSHQLLYLSRKDIEALDVSMTDIIDALEKMFIEKARGETEMPPKPGIHPGPDSFIHAMPGYIPAMRAAGIKWISGYPDNPRQGLPYISGLILLNDPDTGIPTAVMDATWITGRRTGAATALAARYLARPEAGSLGIIACGVQGRNNLLALHTLFDLRRVRAYDINPRAAEAFVREMESRVDAVFEVVDHPRKAVEGMDLVVTSGPIRKEPKPVIEASWLEPGSFCSPVDFDSYFTPGALKSMDKLATDDRAQMEYYREVGYFQNTPRPYGDLAEIVAGRKPGREKPGERTMSINLGLALSDMAVAVEIYQRAREQNAGTSLPL